MLQSRPEAEARRRGAAPAGGAAVSKSSSALVQTAAAYSCGASCFWQECQYIASSARWIGATICNQRDAAHGLRQRSSAAAQNIIFAMNRHRFRKCSLYLWKSRTLYYTAKCCEKLAKIWSFSVVPCPGSYFVQPTRQLPRATKSKLATSRGGYSATNKCVITVYSVKTTLGDR